MDWAWISDESSLWDFHSNETDDALIAKIKELYGVDVSDIASARLVRFSTASLPTSLPEWQDVE